MDTTDRITSLPVEYRLPDQLPNIEYIARQKGVRKALESEYVPKHYIQTHASQIHEELDIKLDTNLDVIVPTNAISRTDYWGWYEGGLVNIEVEYDLYDFWNHGHQVARCLDNSTGHLEEVHVVIACQNGERGPSIDTSSFERLLSTPVFVSTDLPQLPSFDGFVQNIKQELLAAGLPESEAIAKS